MNISSLSRRGRDEVLHFVRHGRAVWHLVPLRLRGSLIVAALLMGVTSAASTLIPLWLGRLVAGLQVVSNQLAAGEPTDSVLRTSLKFLGLLGGVYLGREVINVIRRFLVENTCTRISRDMTVRTLGHVMKADLQSFTHDKVGALHGRVCRSVDGFIRFLKLSFLDFFPVILTGLFALAVSLYKAPALGLVMIGVIPISVALTIWQLVSQKHVRTELIRTREQMDGTMIEQLAGMDYVRAADTVAPEVDRVAHSAERLRSKEIKHHFQMSLFGFGKAVNEGLFHLLVLGLGIYLAVQGQLQFHEIFTYSMLFMNVMAPLSEVHRIIDEGHEASLRVDDLMNILNAPVDRSFQADHAAEPALTVDYPMIRVHDLQVEYRTGDGHTRRALEGVSFMIKRGERVGIAGKSGSGKSTWIKSLLRLNHPSWGSIWLGDQPLEAVSRESIAKLIGYVGQQPFVFEGTVMDNIAYGVPGATPEAVERAAEHACIHEEILQMPGGYQAHVAERGQNLSGGQKQRLAIARLFLKNPPIMILDEATSALDTISERCVQDAIERTHQDRTVIIVAHRLSTLMNCDRIMVFDRGHIIENGTYQELEANGGLFAELLKSAQAPSPATLAAPELAGAH